MGPQRDGQKSVVAHSTSYENMAHQTWLDFVQWLRRIEHNIPTDGWMDGRTDRGAEAITIPPLKRGGDNK